MFPAMIRDWRSLWGYTFPFFFVQIGPYTSRPESNYQDTRQVFVVVGGGGGVGVVLLCLLFLLFVVLFLCYSHDGDCAQFQASFFSFFFFPCFPFLLSHNYNFIFGLLLFINAL
jgi:hypothetical protein